MKITLQFVFLLLSVVAILEIKCFEVFEFYDKTTMQRTDGTIFKSIVSFPRRNIDSKIMFGYENGDLQIYPSFKEVTSSSKETKHGNHTTAIKKIVNIQANYGTFTCSSDKVISWDATFTSSNTYPQTNLLLFDSDLHDQDVYRAEYVDGNISIKSSFRERSISTLRVSASTFEIILTHAFEQYLFFFSSEQIGIRTVDTNYTFFISFGFKYLKVFKDNYNKFQNAGLLMYTNESTLYYYVHNVSLNLVNYTTTLNQSLFKTACFCPSGELITIHQEAALSNKNQLIIWNILFQNASYNITRHKGYVLQDILEGFNGSEEIINIECQYDFFAIFTSQNAKKYFYTISLKEIQKPNNLILIIGLSIGAFVLIVIGGVYFCKYRNKSIQKRERFQESLIEEAK